MNSIISFFSIPHKESQTYTNLLLFSDGSISVSSDMSFIDSMNGTTLSILPPCAVYKLSLKYIEKLFDINGTLECVDPALVGFLNRALYDNSTLTMLSQFKIPKYVAPSVVYWYVGSKILSHNFTHDTSLYRKYCRLFINHYKSPLMINTSLRRYTIESKVPNIKTIIGNHTIAAVNYADVFGDSFTEDDLKVSINAWLKRDSSIRNVPVNCLFPYYYWDTGFKIPYIKNYNYLHFPSVDYGDTFNTIVGFVKGTNIPIIYAPMLHKILDKNPEFSNVDESLLKLIGLPPEYLLSIVDAPVKTFDIVYPMDLGVYWVPKQYSIDVNVLSNDIIDWKLFDGVLYRVDVYSQCWSKGAVGYYAGFRGSDFPACQFDVDSI